MIVTKKERVDSATNLAQGGIAAVLSSEDSLSSHVKDTLDSGSGLCDKSVVEMVVEEGPARVQDLLDVGVGFVRNEKNGKLDLGREGGHSSRRVAHAYDLTGREIERALLAEVVRQENITVLDNYTAVDLLILNKGTENARCVGAYVLEKGGRVCAYTAKVTTLCTGGCGKVYLYTSNPDISTGDGIAMAYRAGAEITNMEFVQFHPTCLYHPQAKNFLISEAVRGEGAFLIDNNGMRFMPKYDERAELATRDTVARAIDKEMKERGFDCVFLDITAKDRGFLEKRFPNIFNKCLEFGLDISKTPIPVVPAAHYMCGGVVVDKEGKSSVDGLLVLGESSNTGLHGGNRLASNSLLEAVVYAEKAYLYCKKHLNNFSDVDVVVVDEWAAGEATDLEEEILINHNWDLIRRIMWNYVGIVRSEKRLSLARERMVNILSEIDNHYKDYLITPNMVELRNISLVAMMVIEASLKRKESRGLHYMVDYPQKSNEYLHWKIFKRKGGGRDWDMETVRDYHII